MAKLSVIIPAYNAEKYIESSVGSLLGQSFSDLEVIVVNDGSTDGTEELLRRLCESDGRLRFLTVPNGGPAAARNRALEMVSTETEYIMFMDADDEIAPDTAEYALKNAGEADMVIFGFTIRNPDGSERSYCEPERHIDLTAMGGALPELYKANLLNQVWGKLYRRQLLRDNSILFPDYRWGEDRLFIYTCLEHARSVTVLPECKYRYIMHPGESLITKFYEKKLDVCLEADERMEALCRQFGAEDESVMRYMFAKSIFSCLTMLFVPSCTLGFSGRRAYVKRVVRNERVHRRCDRVFGGFAVKFLCAVVRTGDVALNTAVFRLVALVGEAAPKLFIKLKHRK